MQTDSLIVTDHYPEEGPIAFWLKKRIKHKRTALVVVLGESGSGKSYLCIRLAEKTDPNFSVRRIVFDVDGFMELLNSGELEPGSVVVFEEAGVNLSAAQWYDIQVKLFAYVLQTFRKLQVIVIFNVPHFGFIAPSYRTQINLQIITGKIDFKRKLCSAEVRYVLKWSYSKSKNDYDVPYTHFTLWIYGRPEMKIKELDFEMPSQELRDAYEIEKDKYIAKLNQDVAQIIKDRGKGGMGTKNSNALSVQQQRVYDLHPDHTIAEIAKNLNVTQRVVYAYIKLIRMKGYDLKKKYKTKAEMANIPMQGPNNGILGNGEEKVSQSL